MIIAEVWYFCKQRTQNRFMFQLYLPEMHMDAKLQVILKGILVTEGDGVKFFCLFFYFLKNHLLVICMLSKDHWLSRLYIIMMAAKHRRHEMEMGKYVDFFDLWPQLLHVTDDDKTKFVVNIGFEDLIGIYCHWAYVLINKRAVVRIENSSGNLPRTAKSPDFCTIWGEEFIHYSKERKSCKLNSCASYQTEMDL